LVVCVKPGVPITSGFFIREINMLGYILNKLGLVVITRREALFVNALLLAASPRDGVARSLRWKLSAVLDRGEHGSKA
jgi:hypothetical protein